MPYVKSAVTLTALRGIRTRGPVFTPAWRLVADTRLFPFPLHRCRACSDDLRLLSPVFPLIKEGQVSRWMLPCKLVDGP